MMEIELVSAGEEMSKIVSRFIWEYKIVKVDDKDHFKLKSGNMSPIYINCRKIISIPEFRVLVTAFMHFVCTRCFQETTCIAGGETAGIPFGQLLAKEMNLPFVYVRKAKKGHGTKDLVEGELPEKGTTLLVEDLITDGGSKLAFIEGLRDAGADVRNCLVIFDRDQGGRRVLHTKRVSLTGLTHIGTCLDVGCNSGHLSVNDATSVENYLKDPKKWHEEKGYEFNE